MNFERLQPLLCRLGFHRRGRLHVPAPEYQRARCRGCKLNMIKKPGERWRLATLADHLPPPKVEPVIAPKPQLEPFAWPKRRADDASPQPVTKSRAPAAAKKPPRPAAAKKPPAPTAAKGPPASAAARKPRRAGNHNVAGAGQPPKQRKPRAPRTASQE